MPKLTPNKLVKLRRELISLVGDVSANKALDWCKAKHIELNELVDSNTILELFKKQGMVKFLGSEDEKRNGIVGTGRLQHPKTVECNIPISSGESGDDSTSAEPNKTEQILEELGVIKPKTFKSEEYQINKIVNETGLTYKNIEALIKEKKDELKGLISTEGALFIIGKELGVDTIEKKLPTMLEQLKKKREYVPSGKQTTLTKNKNIKREDYKNMKDFWDRQEDSSDFLPFLKIKTAVTFTLELVDPEADPRQGVDGYGNNQYIFDVILRGITPKKALEDVNKDGFPLYVIDKSYAFTVKTPGRSKDRFHTLYDNAGPIKTFSYKRTGASFQTDYVYQKVN